MLGTGKYGRPNRIWLLTMIIANAVVAFVLLSFLLRLFAIDNIVLSAAKLDGPPNRWALSLVLLPGAAIAFGCLWYWLVVVGRTRGIVWGGALVYGMIIGVCNIPLGGLILGVLNGAPLFNMLIALLLMLLLPKTLICAGLFGTAMGVFNGTSAQQWIDAHRKR